LPRERVSRLIGELNSDDYPARVRATQELEKRIDQAEPALRAALHEKPAPEVRRRVEQLLEKAEPARSPERLRGVRAVQALEYMSSPQAKELLQALAGGLAGSLQTRQANAALSRLAGRNAP